MKKSLLITIGIILVVIILAIWAYLFIFGKPESPDEIFANFGLGGRDTVPSIGPDTIVDVDGTSPNGSPQRLKQLTTRPVGGASFTNTGIRYMEKGTGHIYEIDLVTGDEILISGTTISQSAKAVFSKDASFVAITTYAQGGNNKTIIQKIGDTNITSSSTASIALPIGAREVEFGNATNTLFYTLKEQSGTSGYSYDVLTAKGTQMFKTVLSDIRVVWGDPIHVYTTPTEEQTGYIYSIEGNGLEYVTNGGPGLMGLTHYDQVIVTRVFEGEPTSYIIKGDRERKIATILIPEKCVSGNTFLYCSSPYNNVASDLFPDAWYKGSVSFNDALWKIHVDTVNSELLIDFLGESGREIDVSQIGINADETRIYFINKNDNTLWMFDTTL